MRTLSCAVLMLVLVGGQTLVAQVQGQWVGTGAMQSTRQYHALVPLTGGNALAAGGVDKNYNVLATAEVYSAGAWTLTNSMVHPRQQFPAVVLANGKVLVSGGLGVGNTVLGSAELYDPVKKQWTSAGFLSKARFGHSATLLLSSGKVLVTGGCTNSNCSTVTAVSEIYDPVSNSWSTTGSLQTARSYHSAVRLNSGKVLVIGSYKGTTTSCELYSPSSGTWSSAASTNVARYLHTSTLLPDGKVVVTGGASGKNPLNSAELYDPAHNTWTLTGNMTTSRYAHTATLLGDGTVLVAGGEGQPSPCGKACTSYIPTAKVDIYNEATGKFTAAKNLNRARAYHATTLVGSGQALADGGIGYISTCCVFLPSAEFYTPLSLRFSAYSLNLGVLQTGLTSAPQTVTVTNVSSHSVVFGSIAKNGDYAQTNTCPATLTAGQSCTITVTFKPTAAGTRNGAVTLHDNCPGNPVQTITLSGIGATNAITPLPGSLGFPSQSPGTSSAAQSVTLYNDGTKAVNIAGIAISPSDGTFTQTSNCPATMNPNTNCVIQVVFTPPDSGNYSYTLSVTDTAKSSPQKVSLSGVGASN